jgi:multimeric flavodoxin WrbA
MNVLALLGRQRKNGNTARIVQMVEARMYALAASRGTPIDFETVFLADHDIRPCRGCRACFDLGEERCPLEDDVPLIRAKMEAADALILASPVYMDDVSGLIKNLIDRLAYLSHRPAMGGTCAFTLATVGGSTTRRTNRTMDAALLTWGFHLASRSGMKMGALATGGELPRFQPSVDKGADRLFSAVVDQRAFKPAFVSLMMFRIQQLVWAREPTESHDRAYWQEKGWLTPGCTFYMPHRANPIKVVLARWTGAIVHHFVA